MTDLTWYELGRIAKHNGYASALDYIVDCILDGILFSLEEMKEVHRGFCELDLIEEAKHYLTTGNWNN